MELLKHSQLLFIYQISDQILSIITITDPIAITLFHTYYQTITIAIINKMHFYIIILLLLLQWKSINIQ